MTAFCYALQIEQITAFYTLFYIEIFLQEKVYLGPRAICSVQRGFCYGGDSGRSGTKSQDWFRGDSVMEGIPVDLGPKAMIGLEGILVYTEEVRFRGISMQLDLSTKHKQFHLERFYFYNLATYKGRGLSLMNCHLSVYYFN